MSDKYFINTELFKLPKYSINMNLAKLPKLLNLDMKLLLNNKQSINADLFKLPKLPDVDVRFDVNPYLGQSSSTLEYPSSLITSTIVGGISPRLSANFKKYGLGVSADFGGIRTARSETSGIDPMSRQTIDPIIDRSVEIDYPVPLNLTLTKSFLEGGLVYPIPFDLNLSKPLYENKQFKTILNRVYKSNANFAKRLKNPYRKFIPDWATDAIATHKMSVGTDEKGLPYIYPEVQEINGKLIDFTRPPYNRGAGMISAEERGDTIHVPTIKDGVEFTENYKKYFPNFQTGGTIPLELTMKSIMLKNQPDPLSAKKGSKIAKHSWSADFGHTVDGNPNLDNMKGDYVTKKKRRKALYGTKLNYLKSLYY